MSNSNFRRDVIGVARHLKSVTGKSWPVVLSKSWALYRFKKMLYNGSVIFVYEKSNGDLRKAIGTLKDVQYNSDDKKKNTYKAVAYYDMEAKDWRSFKVENFISVLL